MVGSLEINKIIRRDFSTLLKQNGFTHLQIRNNWGWHGSCTWVLTIRAVGKHFSGVTGWPPMSLGVWLGVFYSFVPLDYAGSVKSSASELPLPSEHQCQQRSHLTLGLDQRQHARRLTNPMERSRPDIWWIDPDGTNVESVIKDIAQRFIAEGLPWFERLTDILTAYAEIENENDCFHKFSRAAYFAKYLNCQEEYLNYRSKMEQEANRIGRAEWLAFYP